jgi:amino acid transporter
MTGLELGGLVLIAAAAFWLSAQGVPPATPNPASSPLIPPELGLALVFAMLAYGGWSEVATLSAEVKDPKAGIARALVLSVLVITGLYLLVNWALLRGLGLEGLAQSSAPAADLIARAFGPAASALTAIAIALAAFTSINATIIVGGRTTFAAAADVPRLLTLSRWDSGLGIPRPAILAQSAMAMVLVGYGAAAENGFRALVDYTSPLFNGFLLLSALAVIILRVRDPGAVRPFRVPLYPVLPLLFAAACGYMMWSSVVYVTATSPALFGIDWLRLGPLLNGAVLLLGVLGLLWLRRGQMPPPTSMS